VLAKREQSFAQVHHWVEEDKEWAFAHLANKYLFGNDVAQSSAKALEYYYQAVQHGDPNGMCQLATMYYSGARGVEKDWTLAHQLFTVREVFMIHVGGTRCVPSRTDNIMKRRARITLNDEFIRGYIFLFLCHVEIQGRV
jgi:hypothetical protein